MNFKTNEWKFQVLSKGARPLIYFTRKITGEFFRYNVFEMQIKRKLSQLRENVIKFFHFFAKNSPKFYLF